jgi:hypothetical protein
VQNTLSGWLYRGFSCEPHVQRVWVIWDRDGPRLYWESVAELTDFFCHTVRYLWSSNYSQQMNHYQLLRKDPVTLSYLKLTKENYKSQFFLMFFWPCIIV